MSIDHLVNHLTAPSTIRGVIWTLGSVVAFWLLAKDDTKGAVEVLGQAALAVGAVGVFTKDRGPPSKESEDAQ